MMSFINNDSSWFALTECRFHRFAQFPRSYPRHFPVYKGIMQSSQYRSVVLCPLEPTGVWACCQNAGKRDTCWIGKHPGVCMCQQPFFEQTDEGGLSDTGRPYDENHGPWPSHTCSVTRRTDRLDRCI